MPYKLVPAVFTQVLRLGATSEDRAKIDDFAPTPSLWSKISGTRGRPPRQSYFFARL